MCFVWDPTISNGAWVAHQIADGYAPIGGVDWSSSSGESNPYMIHPNIPRVLRVDVYSEEKDLLAGV